MNEARAASHAFEEHTGEVRLRIEATTLPALFEEAAYGLSELLGGDDPPDAASSEEVVTVRAPDREALLVEWLNELIFLSETNKRVYSWVRIDDMSEHEIHAAVRGFEPHFIRTAVKAATLHGLRVEHRDNRWMATLVLDV